MYDLRKDCLEIINYAIESVKPEKVIRDYFEHNIFTDKYFLIAIGKAAWRMAREVSIQLKDKISEGIVVVPYNYNFGKIDDFKIFEAGHPLPDNNSLLAAEYIIEHLNNSESKKVLFLISGGGSALFELPMENITLDDLKELNDKLIKSGAKINEINCVRKHLSSVKGGRFAEKFNKKEFVTLILSDVIGDDLGTIASGPVYPDSSTAKEAIDILNKYKIPYSEKIKNIILTETPKVLSNVETILIGNIKRAVFYAEEKCKNLGYNTLILSDCLSGESKEQAHFLTSIAKKIIADNVPVSKPCAVIIGGETTVTVNGNGIGGRNTEFCLSAANDIKGMDNIIICSVGTDGKDGSSDAAGGIVDGRTYLKLLKNNFNLEQALINNDSYTALNSINDVIKTGPTGTNVNDIVILLCK